jgi:heme oxygenase
LRTEVFTADFAPPWSSVLLETVPGRPAIHHSGHVVRKAPVVANIIAADDEIFMHSRPRHLLLRQATADIHDRLDRGVEEAQYFSKLPRYGLYLQRLHRLHSDFEESLSHAVRAHVSRFNLDKRSALLLADLSSLGLAPLPRDATAGLRTPATDSFSSLLGCLYVMLGAQLGARVLIRKAEHLELPHGRGLAYLTCLSQAKNWPQYLQELENALIHSVDDLLGGATRTFESFCDHLLEPVPV